MQSAGHKQPLWLSGRTDRAQQLAHVSLADGSDNTMLGLNAGTASTGAKNTYVGANVATTLAADLYNNVFVGALAAEQVREADSSVFLGHATGQRASRTYSDVVVGAMAGRDIFQTAENTLVGYAAGGQMISGARNVAVGAYAGHYVVSATDNVFVGATAGQNTRYGDSNVFLGMGAGRENFAGSQNVFVGALAGNAGNRNVLLGYATGRGAAGDNNTFVGFAAGNTASGNDNVILGAETMQAGAGNLNTYVGSKTAGNAIGNRNVGIGAFSCTNGAGNNNVILGTNVGYGLVGDANTFVGNDTGTGTRGNRNTAVGMMGLRGNVGSDNTSLGYGAARGLSGNTNVALGTNAMNNATGNKNVVVGAGTATRLEGDNNTVVGSNACKDLQGNNNAVLGTAILQGIANVSDSVILGSKITVDSDVTSVSNTVIIGSKITLSSRDSECLILSSPVLGDVIRATGNAVLFGTGLTSVEEPAAPIGSKNSTILPAYSPLPYTTTLYGGGATVLYGPDTGTFYPGSATAYAGSQPFDIPSTINADFWTPMALSGDSTITNVNIQANAYVQNVAYNQVWLHTRGIASLDVYGRSRKPRPRYSTRPGYTVSTVKDSSAVTGPAVYAQPGDYFMTGNGAFIIPYLKNDDHIFTTLFEGNPPTDITGFVVRQERYHISDKISSTEVREGATIYVTEYTFFTTGHIRVACVLPENGPWMHSEPYVRLHGFDGRLLAHATVQPVDGLGVFVAYFSPPPGGFPLASLPPWWARVVPLDLVESATVNLNGQRMTVFGKQYTDVYVYRDGSIGIGSETNRLITLYVASKEGAYDFTATSVSLLVDDGTWNDWDQDSQQMFIKYDYPSDVLVHLRIELINKQSGQLFAYEARFRKNSVTLTFTQANAVATDAVFNFTYLNAVYPIPHGADQAYTITFREAPKYVFAGSGLAVLSNGYVKLDDPGVYVGNGYGLHSIRTEGLILRSSDISWDSGATIPGHLAVRGDTGANVFTVRGTEVAVEFPGVLRGNGYYLTDIQASNITGLDLSGGGGGGGGEFEEEPTFTGNVTVMKSLSVKGLLLSEKKDAGPNNFNSGPYVTQGGWTASSTGVHMIPWASIAARSATADNVSGTLYVHASNKGAQTNARNGMAIVSLVKDMGASPDLLIVSMHKSPLLRTFDVSASGNDLQVETDTGCCVCWTFVGAV
jgi:hypothetical protein